MNLSFVRILLALLMSFFLVQCQSREDHIFSENIDAYKLDKLTFRNDFYDTEDSVYYSNFTLELHKSGEFDFSNEILDYQSGNGKWKANCSQESEWLDFNFENGNYIQVSPSCKGQIKVPIRSDTNGTEVSYGNVRYLIFEKSK